MKYTIVLQLTNTDNRKGISIQKKKNHLKIDFDFCVFFALNQLQLLTKMYPNVSVGMNYGLVNRL